MVGQRQGGLGFLGWVDAITSVRNDTSLSQIAECRMISFQSCACVKMRSKDVMTAG